jgi:hypothetical protein
LQEQRGEAGGGTRFPAVVLEVVADERPLTVVLGGTAEVAR